MKVNLKGISRATWIRIIVLVLVLANQISVSFFNHKLLPLTDSQLNDYVTNGLTIATTLWAGWKNNSVTNHAQQADVVLNQLKAGAQK